MSPPPQLRQLTERLGHLINLSRIIDRNRDDSGFSINGEIIYIFDTNVVQMFLEPYKNPQFCEVFHTQAWGSETEADRDANAQACLIAAEYLMSGKLPGQNADGIWYMTNDHKAELDIQEAHLRDHIADNMARLKDPSETEFQTEVFADLEKLTHALDADTSSGRSAFETQARTENWREPWVSELLRLSDKAFRQRAAGIRAREVCRVLARDHVAEPANQLYRYRSAEIASRFMPLEALLDPNPDEQQEVDAETSEWRTLLADVLSRRPGNIRTRGGFKADCQALGLISWAGRQPKYRRKRFVLVTGDAVLLEACRLRYVEEPQLRPYLIRPVNHFAPLFNPVSAQSVLVSQQYAFLKLQQVLEFLLVSLNIQLLVGAEQETRLFARDAFVLEIQRSLEDAIAQVSAAFPQSDDPFWLRATSSDLERLVQELRPIERLMLEAFPNLVAPRLRQERIRFEEAAGDGGLALLMAIEKRLKAASEIGSHFSLQTMPDTTARLFDAIREHPSAERRATVHVRLSFGDGGTSASYEATVARLQHLSRPALRAELDAMKGQPAKIFALAALLAFRLEIWKDAARYSNLAATASIEQTKYVEKLEVAPPDHYEYGYLMAAALRFRLASFEPRKIYAYSDPWGEWLQAADDALEDCIRYHLDKKHAVRAMRARSERAAIHVSYCEWFAFGCLTDPSFYPDPEERALASLKVVVTELRACENNLAAAEAHAIDSDQNSAESASKLMLVGVRRQFQSNVHAAMMTARRLCILWPKLEPAIGALLSILPEPRFDDNWPDGPLIARAYSAAVRGDASALNSLQPNTFRLPLDRVVLEGLKQLVPV